MRSISFVRASFVRSRKFHSDGGAFAFAGAFGKDAAAVFFRDRFYDEEAEASSFDVGQRTVMDAVEALEDAFDVVRRDADSLILHAEDDALFVWQFEAHAHVDIFAGIFNGVVENVENGGAQVFVAAEDANACAVAGCLFEPESFGGQVMAGAGGLHAVAHELAEVDDGFLLPGSLVSGAAGAQDLLDSFGEAVGVAKHEAVELLLLRFGDVAALQGFEMQADRGDRRFQFVGDGIDKAIVLLAAAKLTHKEAGVDDHAGDDEGEEDNAEEQQDSFAPVEDDPAGTEGDSKRDQGDAEANEEDDGSAAAGDAHG